MITLTSRRNPFDNWIKFFEAATSPSQSDQNKIADTVSQGFDENFSRQGNAGQRWRPLAERTVRQRQRLGYPGRSPILRRSGALRDSYVNRGNADHVQEFTRSGDGWTLAVGSRDDRAAVLHHGSTRRNIPARPVTPFSSSREKLIHDTIAFVLEQIQKREINA